MENPFDDPVSERLLLEMYNENHQTMFGMGIEIQVQPQASIVQEIPMKPAV